MVHLWGGHSAFVQLPGHEELRTQLVAGCLPSMCGPKAAIPPQHTAFPWALPLGRVHLALLPPSAVKQSLLVFHLEICKSGW